jgi:hypothetical protein
MGSLMSPQNSLTVICDLLGQIRVVLTATLDAGIPDMQAVDTWRTKGTLVGFFGHNTFG